METALQINDLHYTYNSDFLIKKFVALRGLNLEVKAGESFGFIGHNGAGKTTTMKCILGLIRPKQGEIKIFGESSEKIKSRANLGYLPEQPYFYDHLTVEELLYFYGTLAGVSRSDLKARIQEILEKVGVAAKAKSRMRTLSKGLMQRVALAQSLIANPKLLLLDEPFSGLDPMGRKEFRDIFQELKREGVTLFMSSHVLSDVEQLCDRVSITVKGELKGVYSVKDIPSLTGGRYRLVIEHAGDCDSSISSRAESFTRHERFITLEFLDRDIAQSVLAEVLSKKYLIENFEFVHGNLEDLFVKVSKS